MTPETPEDDDYDVEAFAQALEDAVKPSHSLAIGLHVDKHAELPHAASSVKAFIHAMGEVGDFALDIQVVVNAPKLFDGRQTEAIGFAHQDAVDAYDDDDESESGVKYAK